MDIEPDESYVTHGPALLSRAALHCGLFRTQGNPRPAKRRPVLLSAGPARSRSTPCVHADYAADSSPQRSPSTATPSATAPSPSCSNPTATARTQAALRLTLPRPPRSARPRGAAPMTWRRWPRTTRRPDLPARQPTLRAPLLADNHQPAPSSDGAPSPPNPSCAVALIDRLTHHAEIPAPRRACLPQTRGLAQSAGASGRVVASQETDPAPTSSPRPIDTHREDRGSIRGTTTLGLRQVFHVEHFVIRRSAVPPAAGRRDGFRELCAAATVASHARKCGIAPRSRSFRCSTWNTSRSRGQPFHRS